MKDKKTIIHNSVNNEAVTVKGHRLSDIVEFNEKGVKALLEGKVIGNSIVFFDSVVSTNDEAKNMGFDGAREGSVVVALKQTGGRGSKGRSWLSCDGEGIFCSVITRPKIAFSDVPVITLIAGLSVCRALRKVTKTDALIKWPNDIVINGKKICGILSESYTAGEGMDFVVTGIGINCDNEKFEGELETIATSVMIETGEKINKAYLLAEVLNEFEKDYFAFIKYGFEAMYDEYKALSAVIGKNVRINGAESYYAEAVDIKKSGELVVKADGKERTVYANEVSLRF
ncbi:MAG: biotin--[acetyl-CoA-carboxylase] ligase [Lachnospiraceae bacterium]|nr:biotin--[acetyl-CoA-carboxylase] ligase [Lachnospiraceae bacterium]